MSVAFLMDEHVKGAITAGLVRRGVDVLTAQADGSDGLSDPDLLDRAGALGRVLFTQDDDFLVIAAYRQRRGIPFNGIVYAHQQRVSTRTCIEDLETVAKASDVADWKGKLQLLPL